MTNNFNQYIKDEKLLSNLKSLNYNEMTQIQSSSLPIILEKKDIIAKAKTRSGKTISFGLGILNNLRDEYKIQALILCPTRELAFQVAKSLRELARHRDNIKILNLTGGLPYHPQAHSLKHKAHILVATPGRLLKHLKEQNFSPEDIHTLVLDEADRMLDM
jgi:ATP-independent RNA helicase DbpA